MAWQALSCKTASRPRLREKKRAVKLGGLHRPLNLPTEGGMFPSEGNSRERVLDPRPRKEPSAGATGAGDTFRLVKPDRDPKMEPSIHLVHTLDKRDQPFATGSATKRDDPPLRTRIKTVFLLSLRAA